MWILLYITIILTSVAIIPAQVPDIFWIPKEAVYTMLSFSLIGYSFFANVPARISFYNRWIGILLIYAIVSFGWFFYLPLLFPVNNQFQWNVWNIRPTLNFLSGLLLIKILVEHTDSLYRWVVTAKVLCWMAAIFSVYALLQWCGIDQIFGASEIIFTNSGRNRPEIMMTFFGNKFLTSNYLAMISPLCLMFKEFRYKVMYSLIFLTLCLTDTALSMVAFLAGLLGYLLWMRKYLFFVLMVCVSVGVLIVMSMVYPEFLSNSGRTDLWKIIFNDIVQKHLVFTGAGLGSFPRAYHAGALQAMSAHNEFLQMFKEVGLIFIGIVVVYLVSLTRKVWSYYKRNNSMLTIGYGCALLTYFVICLGGFPLRIAPLALIGILYIACLEAQIQGENYGT